MTDPGRPLRFARFEFPPAAISFAITPKTRGDEEKVSAGLKRLSEEDPAMEVRFDPQTKEMLISGTSQVHVEVILDKLKRRFGVEVDPQPPQVALPGDHPQKRPTPKVGIRNEPAAGASSAIAGSKWNPNCGAARAMSSKMPFLEALSRATSSRLWRKALIEAMEHGWWRLSGGGCQGQTVRRLIPHGGLV